LIVSKVKRAKARVGELNEQRWSVLSERGREAGGLTYAAAAALVRHLLGEKIHGTCVVTDDAAARVNGDATRANKSDGATPSDNGTPRDNGGAHAKKRRAPRRAAKPRG
jgi:hypothetical protein